MNFTVWVIKSLVWLHLYSCVRMFCQKCLKHMVCTDCLSDQVLRLSQISLLNMFVKFNLINLLHASLVMWGTFLPLEPPSPFFSWNHHHLSSTINSSRSTVTYLDNFLERWWHFYFYNQHQSHVSFRNIIKFDLLGLSWHFFFLQPLSHSF